MKNIKENTKISLIKKILVSLLSLILVFSSVTTYQYQNDKIIEANATESNTIRNKAMQLLAVILASIGVKITSDIDLNSMESLYQQLSPSAKNVIDNFDYNNKYSNGYYGLHVGQYQEIAHSIIDTLKLWTVELGTTFISNDLGVNVFNSFDANNYFTYGYMTSGLKTYSLPNVSLPFYTTEDYNFGYTPLYNYNQRMEFNAVNTLTTSFAIVPFSKLAHTSNSIEWNTNDTINPSDLVFALKIVTDGNYMNKEKIDGAYYFPLITGLGYASSFILIKVKTVVPDFIFNGLSLLYADTLTLPAPLGGWDDSEAGDIDVPSPWQRALDFLGLPLVVLGNLTAQELEDLKNKGPIDVTTGDLPTEVIDDFAKDTTTDTGIDIPDSSDIPETNAGLGAWLGGALGALGNAITGAIKGVLSGLGSILNSILGAILGLGSVIISSIIAALTQLFTWDLDATKLKFDELRGLMMLRIPCVNETVQAWVNIMGVNGHNLTSSFTLFGRTVTWNSGQLLSAFSSFASLIQQAFKFVFWFIFLKGMRRRITAFLSAMSVDMNIGGKL